MEYVSSLPKLIKYCKSDVLFQQFITIRTRIEDNKLELYFGRGDARSARRDRSLRAHLARPVNLHGS